MHVLLGMAPDYPHRGQRATAAHPTMAEEHTVESYLKSPERPYRVGALFILSIWPLASLGAGPDGSKDEKAKANAKAADVKAVKVSYDKQIRPIFQAHCQGCHQPAKAGGGYVMTAFDRLLKGGESEDRGHRAGQARREPPDRADHAPRTARPRCPRTSRRWPSPRSS